MVKCIMKSGRIKTTWNGAPKVAPVIIKAKTEEELREKMKQTSLGYTKLNSFVIGFK